MRNNNLLTKSYCNQKKTKACESCMNVKCNSNNNPVVKLLNQSVDVLATVADNKECNQDIINDVLNQYLRLN